MQTVARGVTSETHNPIRGHRSKIASTGPVEVFFGFQKRLWGQVLRSPTFGVTPAVLNEQHHPCRLDIYQPQDQNDRIGAQAD
jgi:hypothetical protein